MAKDITSDKERFFEFLKVLPEHAVRFWIEMLEDARYTDSQQKMRFSYKDYFPNIASQYVNKKIQESFKKFNESFANLSNFFTGRFYYNHKSKLFELFPEMRDSEEKNKLNLWNKNFTELEKLVIGVEKRYEHFTKTAVEVFSEKGEHQTVETQKKKKSPATVLYLDKSGNLYREPKNKYTYPLEANSDRYRVILFLAQNPGLQKTKMI